MTFDNKPVERLLSSNNYDIRVSHNARWIDQKCTPDVVSIVADCILEYTKTNGLIEFTSKDIWHFNYTVNNVLDIFKKPSPIDHAAKNEYDKFFQQPMELLAYSGVLKKKENTRRNIYTVVEDEILFSIALSERSALRFLVSYIQKVLLDSGLYDLFQFFFDRQDGDSYIKLKGGFTLFTKTFTPINGNTECYRIFTKVVNPLSYNMNARGTEKGRLSQGLITYDMLMYNRENFRDINQRKPKGIPRGVYSQTQSSVSKYFDYMMAKAIRFVKYINQMYNFGLSEFDSDDHELASEIHHIFPKSSFPQISFFLENLINLTPNQHRNHAHPQGNFQAVDSEYQKLLIIAKVATIRKSLEENWGVYEFNNLLTVLSTGYQTDVFNSIAPNDFNSVIQKVHEHIC